MSTSQLIATIEAKLAESRQKVAQYIAETRGYETQLASLRGSIATTGEIAAIPRTEAILATLRTTEGTLSPTQILTRLLAAGRNDDLHKVTATLDYLVKAGLVIRPERGRYLGS